MGEHLVCNPCGKEAGCARVHRWPGPEVLLSLLSLVTLDYIGHHELIAEKNFAAMLGSSNR
jgi:hypothetical protein